MRACHIIRVCITGILLAGNTYAYLSLSVNQDIANALGIDLNGGSFAVTTNTLTFGRADLEYFSGGVLKAGHFIITAIPWTQQLEMLDTKSGRSYLINHAHIGEASGALHIINADITATTNTTSSGVLSNSGTLVVGEFFAVAPWTYTPVPAPAAELPSCMTNFGSGIEVQLTAINSMQQVARSNGLVALTMSTRLRNIGVNDVPWFWAIDPPGPIQPITGQHPFATFNLYRLEQGVLRQIGKSDVKHAFYSTNIECDCPGAQVIFSGCEDVYGTFNNAEQFYFGPRSEVHAYSGTWNSLGSHFDVSAAEPVPDNVRSHSSETNAFAHRLVVPESGLMSTSAQYFVESWYLVKDSTNQYSGMGYRRVAPLLTNGVWIFTTATTLTNGPAIDVIAPRHQTTAWKSHQVLDTSEGLVHVAANVSPLGNGRYRYGYSIMNLNFDRQMKSFSLPVSPGTTITNTIFNDADTDSTNDWVVSEKDGWLTWTMSATNGLSWGTLFSFSLEADTPPATSSSGLSSWEPGPTNVFHVTTLAPAMKIAGLLSTDEQTQLGWPSVSGAVYQVEMNDTGLETGWQSLGLTITAASPAMVVIDTNTPSDRLFYRLKLISAP